MSSPISPSFWFYPFFWAFLAMIGWYLGFFVVGSKIFGKGTLFGIGVVALAEIPRIILPLNQGVTVFFPLSAQQECNQRTGW
jgi:hypothetical protein